MCQRRGLLDSVGRAEGLAFPARSAENADQCRTRAAACLSCETSMPPEGCSMLLSKIGTGFAVGAALILGASPALAAGGWTIVSIPPTGQNANLQGVSQPRIVQG
jgi:hypothetical protein